MRREDGFTLLDMLLVVGLVGIMAAIAVPPAATAVRRYQLRAATREVAAQIRAARLRAVTSNRTMRVRFNCPAAGQFRVVEVVGVAAVDGAADRCSLTAYPYPSPAPPAARPNHDGPVVALPGQTGFGGFQDIDIAANGRVTPLAGGLPVTITVADNYENQNLTVSASGRVQLPQAP